MAELEWVPLAEVARPHGVRGELRLRVFNPDSDVLLDQREVRVSGKGGEPRVFAVKNARRANEAILMQLAGIDDRDAAEALRGSSIDVPRAAFERLDEDEFYAVDVIGKPAFEQAGEGVVAIGTVSDFVIYPSVGVFIVALDSGGTLDVPSTDEFVVSVDRTGLLLHGLEVLRELAESAKAKPKVKPAPREG